jgi:hypothetical protein
MIEMTVELLERGDGDTASKPTTHFVDAELIWRETLRELI